MTNYIENLLLSSLFGNSVQKLRKLFCFHVPIAKLNPSSGFADLGGKPLNPSLNNHYGILTVTASKFTVKFVEGRKWIQFLPIFSAGVVMIVGLSIIVNTLVSAKIILINP